MAPSLVHLPNGQTVNVSPVFGGLFFKANELNTHHGEFPPGWTVNLETEDSEEDHRTEVDSRQDEAAGDSPYRRPQHHIHRYRKPTLRNDTLFLSSISQPSSSDFKPAASPARQIAMMLWATLWWYFHQPPPNPHISTGTNSKIPEAGRPKAEWRINIRREGIFRGRNILSKLERMGLISSEESSVGADVDERTGEGWTEMFVSQRSFWQIDGRIFLFTLSPTTNSPFPPGTPHGGSRPGSPSREGGTLPVRPDVHSETIAQGLWSPSSPSGVPGPFTSASHLPTFYPPPPAQYIMTHNVRHPIRPKPPRQGETFYTRYTPSIGQYLSFRVASLSSQSTTHRGPVGSTAANFLPPNSALAASTGVPNLGNMCIHPCDTDLLHNWMNNPRVSAAWGVSGPIATQEAFLKNSLSNKHSFPAIGCWDGKPFGYFEIYWVKEDQLGKHLGGSEIGDWDRGIHVLVGEEEFRGKDRVKVWLSALVHYCWLADQRTERVFCEPRLDNERFIEYLQDVGFCKEREIAFPFKQAALMKMARDSWDAPVL
ncbi:hypothetical protein MMC11_005475 [Xylographa trunciseda]|nr:hypothetical protein [Xylographa trunciseda]